MIRQRSLLLLRLRSQDVIKLIIPEAEAERVVGKILWRENACLPWHGSERARARHRRIQVPLSLLSAGALLQWILSATRQATAVSCIEESALGGGGELRVPRCQWHDAGWRIDRLGRIHISLCCPSASNILRNCIEDRITSATVMCSCKPLVMWNNALVRGRVEVVVGRHVCATVLSTSTSSGR